MHIGLLQVQIHFPGASSLKDKRRVLKSLKDKLRNKFNIALAEIGEQNLWQRTTLAIITIANEQPRVSSIFNHIMEIISRNSEVEVTAQSIEML